MQIQDKIRGCLVGGAVGDALGYPVEFLSDEVLFARYGSDGMTAYSLSDGVALFSDDTQMTLFSANAVLSWETAVAGDNSDTPLNRYVYEAYRDWLQTQGQALSRQPVSWIYALPELHSLRAPGNTCLGALSSGRMGTFNRPLNNSKGCGGIMRAAPFGLDAFLSAEQAFDEACAAAVITHGHPFGWLPAGVLAFLVHRLVFDGLALKDAVRSCIEYLIAAYPGEEADSLADWMEMTTTLPFNGLDDAENIKALDRVGHPAKGGWTGESALYISLYAAMKYEDDFDRAVSCAVNIGEDRDSTGAVTGNLVGASVGYGSIDARWTQPLELRDTILTIADDLNRLNAVDRSFMQDAAWLKKYGA